MQYMRFHFLILEFSEYFEYAMEAPKSLKQKEGEPTMSYINKGNCDFA